MELTDFPELVELLERIEAYDNPPYRTTEGEIRRWVGSTTVWNGIVGIGASGQREGQIVCYGHVALLRGNSSECLCQGGVDPQYRSLGLGQQVIGWETEAGRKLLQQHEANNGQIIVNVDIEQEHFESHLTRMGFEWVSSTHELRRQLSNLPDLPELGNYLEIQPWDSRIDDEARHLYNRILEKPIADSRQSREQWKQQQDSFVEDWSFVAFDKTGDRPNLAGFIIVGSYDNDWDVLGWKEGYIDLLGVPDSWATNEISKALVIFSMKAQLDSGMEKVATGVTGGQGSPEVRFFEELGFERSFETRTYAYAL